FALQSHALGADGGQMRAPRNHRDVGARFMEFDREKTPDRTRAEDGDLHLPSPSFSASPMRWSLPVAPLGISGRNRIFRGTLKSATRAPTKARNSRSSQAEPSRNTTAAAISSPNMSCGTAKVTTCATAG